MQQARGAVVTGGAGGLGRALAATLVGRGLRVRVADRDQAAAEQVAAELGPLAVAAHLDVTDPAASTALAEQVAAEDGLAVWVNNAGVLFTRPSWEHPAHEVAAMLGVNVQGLMHGTWAALGPMRAQRAGHVLNVVSLAGLTPVPGETVYAATKHAALAFSVGTLQDLRLAGYDAVHVSALCPDGIWTPMLQDKVDDPQAALSWSGTLLRPEQVADQAARVLDRPRPVRSVPRWRGGLCRALSAAPGPSLRLAPLVMAQARRKQRAFGRALDRDAPPHRRW